MRFLKKRRSIHQWWHKLRLAGLCARPGDSAGNQFDLTLRFNPARGSRDYHRQNRYHDSTLLEGVSHE
jgi:hypothetical protein